MLSVARRRENRQRIDEIAEGQLDEGGHLASVAAPPSRALRMLGTIGLISIVLALFGLAAINALMVENQTKIDALGSDVVAAQLENERLRVQLAELEAPQRIVAEAEGRLGMVVPAEVVYLTPPTGVLSPEQVDAALVGVHS